jgi:hypothetical protein
MAFTSTEQQAWEDRVVLICKPEQSGKTFIMIQQLIKDLEEPMEGKTVINFILCDNSLLLTKQTSVRVQSELTYHEEELSSEVDGEIICKDESCDEEDSNEEKKNFYVEFSTGKGAKRDIPAIWYAITGPEPVQNIVCCTNSRRVLDISTIIHKLNRTPNFQDKFIFNIWLDEADKFTKFIGNTFRPLLYQNDNVQLYFLTATPKALFDKYGDLNVFPLESTTSPNYHGWKDNHKIILENESGTTEDFIHHVLTNVVSESPKPGSKWYIPASTKKVMHEKVRDSLVGKGFAVFVVNGDGLALSIPGEGRICEKKTEELNTQMLSMYRKKNVARFPVAVTGNICVGRGISIMSEDFIFDYGILSNCAKKAEASQNAGRLKGNMKHWPNYKPPTVFTTPKFDKVATEMEEKSRRLATLAFDKQQGGEKPVISKPDFKEIGNEHAFEFDWCVFPDDKTALAWIADPEIGLGKKMPKVTITPETLRKNFDGNNPTAEYLIKRKFGMAADGIKTWIRKYRTNTNEICVYWRKGPKCPPHYQNPRTATPK